jgi:hypothetical protein
MAIPNPMLSIRLDLYRPFGSLIPTEIDLPGRIVPAAEAGRRVVSGDVQWTHFLDVDTNIDIRDGCTRTTGENQLTYADGDEIRIADTTARYVVVWVETQNEGTPQAFKRAYLMRHTA